MLQWSYWDQLEIFPSCAFTLIHTPIHSFPPPTSSRHSSALPQRTLGNFAKKTDKILNKFLGFFWVVYQIFVISNPKNP